MLFSVLLHYLLKGLAYIPCWLNQRSAERSGKVKPNNHIGASAKIEATRPEGAEAHSPGHPPWVKFPKNQTPCKGKSVIYQCFCPCRASCFYQSVHPGRVPWAMCLLGFQPVFDHIISFTGQQYMFIFFSIFPFYSYFFTTFAL